MGTHTRLELLGCAVLLAALTLAVDAWEEVGLRGAAGAHPRHRSLLTSPTAAQKAERKGANNNMASAAALGTAGSQSGLRNRTGPGKRVGFLDISDPLTDIDPLARPSSPQAAVCHLFL